MPPFRPGFGSKDPPGPSLVALLLGLAVRFPSLIKKTANARSVDCFFMELAGIEPASKDSSMPVSSIIVFVLRFPHRDVQRQT